MIAIFPLAHPWHGMVPIYPCCLAFLPQGCVPNLDQSASVFGTVLCLRRKWAGQTLIWCKQTAGLWFASKRKQTSKTDMSYMLQYFMSYHGYKRWFCQSVAFATLSITLAVTYLLVIRRWSCPTWCKSNPSHPSLKNVSICEAYPKFAHIKSNTTRAADLAVIATGPPEHAFIVEECRFCLHQMICRGHVWNCVWTYQESRIKNCCEPLLLSCHGQVFLSN